MTAHIIRRLKREKDRQAELAKLKATEQPPRKNKRQWITRAQAIEYAKRILKGESLASIAKREHRSYQRLNYWMNHYGFGVQTLKREFTSDGFRR